MSFWILITLALTFQQGLTVIAVLTRSHELHYSIVVISLIWLVVSSIEIFLGYFCGKWLKVYLANSRFEKRILTYVKKLEDLIDRRGEKVAMTFFSYFVFPFIPAFIGAWLDISFVSIFFCTLLGDFFWYVISWIYALGAVVLLSKVKMGLLIIIGVAIILVLVSHFAKRKIS